MKPVSGPGRGRRGGEMPTIIKFEKYRNYEGEYVPLIEYQRLEALIQRVNKIGPSLHVDSIANIIYGERTNTDRLIQLLKDCQNAIDPLPFTDPPEPEEA